MDELLTQLLSPRTLNQGNILVKYHPAIFASIQSQKITKIFYVNNPSLST